ncbi:MAG TPA: phosphate ABC transporter substrate-binding protein PstS, partial [Bryobacteraceae bacterium]|nr:phosphate ABC transporter substrate-binding protein PstS [Bryobacteraceae bacterium]
MNKIIFTGVAALSALFAVTAPAQNLNGAGATFPDPIYKKWFGEFKAAHSGVQINYQAIGSGGGIRQLTEGTVDFGASDMPMTDQQKATVKIAPLHFPTVLGGVVLTYNIPGVTAKLKFTPEIVAGIYLGAIQKWNDAKISAVNPGVKLPGDDIVVVHRSDGSGTTFVFCDYLSKVSSTWK